MSASSAIKQPCEMLYDLKYGCPKLVTKPPPLHLPSLANRHILLLGDSVSTQLKSWFACRTKSSVICLEAFRMNIFNSSVLSSTQADTVWLMFGAWYITGSSSTDTELAAENYIVRHVPHILVDLQEWLNQKSGRVCIFSSPPVQHWHDLSGGFTREHFMKCQQQIARRHTAPFQIAVRNLCSNGSVGSPTFRFFSAIEEAIRMKVWKAASMVSKGSMLLFLPLTELTLTLSPVLQHPGFANRLGGTCDCTHYCDNAHAWDQVFMNLDDLVHHATHTNEARADMKHCPDRTSFWLVAPATNSSFPASQNKDRQKKHGAPASKDLLPLPEL